MRYYILLCSLFVIALSSCSNNSQNEYLASADSTSLSGNVADINSSSRKISKDANIKCRVTDVLATTTHIEQMVKSMGGLVAESNFENAIIHQRQYSYTTDSLKQVRTYTPTAHLTLRISTQYLDSIMQTLPAMVNFVEQRKLQQTDLTLAYLGNALKKQVTDTVSQTEQQLTAVDRRMENLHILDRVNYATLTVALIQPAQVYTEIIADTDAAIRAPFYKRIGQSFLKGVIVLEEMIVALLTIWPVWLIVLGIVIWYRRSNRKVKSAL
jgi:hypothetical protein